MLSNDPRGELADGMAALGWLGAAVMVRPPGVAGASRSLARTSRIGGVEFSAGIEMLETIGGDYRAQVDQTLTP